MTHKHPLATASLALVALLTQNLEATAQHGTAVATLSIPRGGVSGREVLGGKLNMPGYPVLLVRADFPDAKWWVQDHPVVKADGRFEVRARFGNHKTQPGTRFKVVVLVLHSTGDFDLWEPGDVVEKLPPLVPRSEEQLAIYRKFHRDVEILKNVISTPRPDAIVHRVSTITGSLKGHYPVTLVRSAEPNSPWWVQAPVKYDNNTHRFSGRLVFGNRNTHDECRFQVVVLALKKRADLRNFKEGQKITELPAALPQSAETTVIYRGALLEDSAP